MEYWWVFLNQNTLRFYHLINTGTVQKILLACPQASQEIRHHPSDVAQWMSSSLDYISFGGYFSLVKFILVSINCWRFVLFLRQMHTVQRLYLRCGYHSLVFYPELFSHYKD